MDVNGDSAALGDSTFVLFSWWRLLWLLKVVASFMLTALLGYHLVKRLRIHCKKTDKIWKLTVIVFMAPITLHVVMSVLYYCGFCGRVFCDCLSFGFVAGIIHKLASKPTGAGTVKLIVQQINKPHTDVWLDSTEMVIGEVRNRIAEALHIVPANRVSIESGKGTFLEDLSQPLFSLLDDSARSTDFFGFVTSTCYVSVREEDLRPKVTFQDLGAEDARDRMNDKKSPNPFRGLLRSEIKFGDLLNLTARIAADSQCFYINLMDKFACAAPSAMQLPSVQVRLQSWSALDDQAHISDGVSEAGELNSVSSGAHARRSRGFFFSRRKPSDPENLGAMFGKPVHNGDTVVIEAGGKYMSVTRGWWMAWSSTEPRRSGAFVVEIIERAPQNKLKELTEQIKGQLEKIGQRNAAAAGAMVDNVLRPGDMFRLRSVKFPDFELGITSVKLQDEFCYLGLRKIEGQEDDENDWCMGVRFSVKNHTLSNELFKI